MDKDFWASIAKDDYKIPEGHMLENLTSILFSYLGSTDPELRDDIAYMVYANWLKQEMYPGGMLKAHVDILLSNLDKGIGETDSDTVFIRAFSVLFLAEIVHNDNKKPLLEKDQLRAILEKGIWYLETEKDPRGHIPGKGWAHALAHTADLLLVLGCNRHMNEADLWNILAAISNKITHSTNHIYVHGEDNRLANAVVEILRRELISLDKVEAWTKSFTGPDGKYWKGVFVEQERNRAFHNTSNLLRSIYFELVLDTDEIPQRERLTGLVLHTIKILKPY